MSESMKLATMKTTTARSRTTSTRHRRSGAHRGHWRRFQKGCRNDKYAEKEDDEEPKIPGQENREAQDATNKQKARKAAAGEKKKPRILKPPTSCPAEAPIPEGAEPAL